MAADLRATVGHDFALDLADRLELWGSQVRSDELASVLESAGLGVPDTSGPALLLDLIKHLKDPNLA